MWVLIAEVVCVVPATAVAPGAVASTAVLLLYLLLLGSLIHVYSASMVLILLHAWWQLCCGRTPAIGAGSR